MILYVTGRGSHFGYLGGSLPFSNKLGARTIHIGRVAIRVCSIYRWGEGVHALIFFPTRAHAEGELALLSVNLYVGLAEYPTDSPSRKC